jgi:hypothetical protein
MIDVPFDPYFQWDMWFSDCPMCMATIGAETKQESAEEMSDHIVNAHGEELFMVEAGEL